jgi:predicted AAA+ superfamily ATPase
MGVVVSAPPRVGKTFLTHKIIERVIGDDLVANPLGKKALYCRLRSDSTVKSVYRAICKATGCSAIPERTTRAQLEELMSQRFEVTGTRVLIIDEMHHLLGSKKEPVNLFLKSLIQDQPAICPILIGTNRLREFIFDDEANDEIGGRMFDMHLTPFSEAEFTRLLNIAIPKYAECAGVGVSPEITADPQFAKRIYVGCKASFGRAMRLIATSTIHAKEEGGHQVEPDDYRFVFDLQFKRFNPQNPFGPDWSGGESAEPKSLKGSA